jgi:hypothetical protein
MSPVLVGEVHPSGDDPFDVFATRAIVKADRVAKPVEGSACRLAIPS